MSATVEPPAPVGLDISPVEHLSEYVIGFPVHVAITVHAPPDTNFNALPFADFFTLRGCIGAQIIGPRGFEPQQFKPNPYARQGMGARGTKLRAGESRRMLADVSDYFASAIEGDYRVRFSYVETLGTYNAPPVPLHFRNPTSEEATLLAAAAPDRPKFDSWGTWMISCPQTLSSGPITTANPLRFNLALRNLICSPEPLDRLDPAPLRALTGLYAPEAAAFEAELAQARGDTARYQQLKSWLQRVVPGLNWWVQMMDNGGGGFLKSIRPGP